MLPKVGELLAVPLNGGWWGACWVARRGKPEPGTSHLGDFVVVAAADWFARKRPSAEALGTPKVLTIDYEGYDEPALFNVNDPVGAGVTAVGTVAKRPRAGIAPWVSGWERIAYVLDQQRRWNLDREASLAKYEAQKAVWAKENARAAAAEAARIAAKRSALTIGKLRRAKLLRAWDGAMKPALVKEARGMLAELLDALAAKKKNALRDTVRAFNRWDGKHGVIETAAREALHEQLCDIAAAAGLGNVGDAIDKWRDW